MKCPHCGIGHKEEIKSQRFHNIDSDTWFINWVECPDCNKIQVNLDEHTLRPKSAPGGNMEFHAMVYPIISKAKIFGSAVPDPVKKDYQEACSIEHLSQNGAGAIYRRCLQSVLRNVGVKKGKLFDEIIEFEKSGTVSSGIITCLQALRKFGNFAAHPDLDKNTATIVDVQPGEVEFCRGIIEDLFDELYI